MRYIKFFICVACCFCTFLSRSEAADVADHEGVPSTIDLHGHPSSVVAGMVNVVSGHLVDQDVDSLGVGPKPVMIQRYYNSGNTQQRGTLCDGWDLNLHQDITFSTQEISKREKAVYAEVSDRGSRYLFTDTGTGSEFKCKIDKDLFK